jgi:AcrR family transcriptional regulator
MPKVVDKKQRRRELALAALDAFAESGFSETSISRIARRAGCGKGTLYEYFESKDELILAAIQAWFDGMTEQARGQSDEIRDPEAKLRAFVRSVMEASMADPRTTRLTVAVFQQLMSRRDMLADHAFIQQAGRSFREAIASVLREGVEQGVFQPRTLDRAQGIAVNLLAFLDGIFIHWLVSNGYFDLQHQIELHLTCLIASLRAGGPAP